MKRFQKWNHNYNDRCSIRLKTKAFDAVNWLVTPWRDRCNRVELKLFKTKLLLAMVQTPVCVEGQPLRERHLETTAVVGSVSLDILVLDRMIAAHGLSLKEASWNTEQHHNFEPTFRLKWDHQYLLSRLELKREQLPHSNICGAVGRLECGRRQQRGANCRSPNALV